MYRKLLFILFTILFISPATVQADPEEIIDYNLSLAGYRLGMSFDEATAVRPFHYFRDGQETSRDISVTEAFIDQVYIDEIETNLWVSFQDGKIFKIIIRFSPDATEEMMQRFKKELGPCENKSRVLTNLTGAEIQQTVCQWIFPNEKVYLIKISSNTDYATISLTNRSKRKKKLAEED